jgi:hypothetical protein
MLHVVCCVQQQNIYISLSFCLSKILKKKNSKYSRNFDIVSNTYCYLVYSGPESQDWSESWYQRRWYPGIYVYIWHARECLWPHLRLMTLKRHIACRSQWFLPLYFFWNMELLFRLCFSYLFYECLPLTRSRLLHSDQLISYKELGKNVENISDRIPEKL